jgi:hypothetical protein
METRFEVRSGGKGISLHVFLSRHVNSRMKVCGARSSYFVKLERTIINYHMVVVIQRHCQYISLQN